MKIWIKKYEFIDWTNFKFEKKVAFLILNCVESRLDLNHSRWIFFSKVYIIRGRLYLSDTTMIMTPRSKWILRSVTACNSQLYTLVNCWLLMEDDNLGCFFTFVNTVQRIHEKKVEVRHLPWSIWDPVVQIWHFLGFSV